MVKIAILGLIIRGMSILSRFLLFAYLGKFLPTSEYGVFGLLQSGIAVGVYLIGLDLYIYVTREIPKRNITDVQNLILSQFTVYGVAYSLFFIVLMPVFGYKFVPSGYVACFCIVLMLEHVTFELIRILVAVQHPLLANMSIFLRSFVWIMAFLLVTYINPVLLSVKSLLAFWISGLVISLAVSMGLLFKLKVLSFSPVNIDTVFIKAALKGSVIFLIASLSYNLILASGRYFLQHYYSSFEVGIFSFFQNMAVLLDVFIYTAVVMIILPRLIESKDKGNDAAYRRNLGILQSGIFYGTLLLAGILFITIVPFLYFIGKEEMIRNTHVFRILLLGASIYCLSNIGHYLLYINNQEKLIMLASIAGLAGNIVMNFLLIPVYGLYGAAFSVTASMLIMGGLKIYLGHKSEPIRSENIFSGFKNLLVHS